MKFGKAHVFAKFSIFKRRAHALLQDVDVAVLPPQHPAPGEAFKAGSGFSGICISMLALEKAGHKCQHVFAIEKDKVLRRILVNKSPALRRRCISCIRKAVKHSHKLPPHFLQLSSPCPDFPSQGCGGGVGGSSGGLVLDGIELAVKLRPSVAVEEQVRGFLFKKHRFARKITAKILRKPGYRVYNKVLNTMSHGAIPHCRNRFFRVSIHRSSCRNPFIWPGQLPCLGVKKFLKIHIKGHHKLPPKNPSSQNRERNLVKKVSTNLKEAG